MQMESWRERGFVPDSDDDEAFETQETANLGTSGLDGNLDDDVAVEDTTRPGKSVEVSNDESDNEGALVSMKASHGNSQNDTLRQRAGDNDNTGNEGNDGSQMAVLSGEGNDAREKSPEQTDGDGTQTALSGQEHPSNLEPSKEKSQDRPAAKKPVTRPRDSLNASPPSTARTNHSLDIWDVPSSPDELQLDKWRTERPVQSSKGEELTRTRSMSEDSRHSPLSSPPPSIQSLRLDEDLQGQTEQVQEIAAPRDDLEDLLPPLDIPDDLLEELSQPARRSLRQRNPIQLYPYLLEDAKYQTLMKARGVRPVRIAQYQQALRAAANESQGQEYVDPQPPSSSPVQNLQPPSSSPATPQTLEPIQPQWDIPGCETSGDAQRLSRQSTSARPRTYKRRKITHADTIRDHQRKHQDSSRSRQSENTATARGVNRPSIFDIPPSPPRSGSGSSTPNADFSSFRFPPGATPPPLTTPVTEPKLQSTDTDNGGAMDHSDSIPRQNSPAAISISSQSQSDSDGEGEEGSDDEVRRLRRRMKGVLPASWLRLDLKKQEERMRSSQRDRDSTQRSKNAKGVAKKTNRRNIASGSDQRLQWTSMMDLADNDDEDEGDENDRDTGRDDAGQTLSDIAGFENNFNAQDFGDDIPEDNRIDYMFPPIPRGPQQKRRKKGVKRQRSERDGINTGRNWKRARLKRQTRLTDPVYGSRKAKQSSSTSRRFAVLDAPDVAQRPRKKQPPFLRVAARQARLRREKGRPRNRTLPNSGSTQDTGGAHTSSRQCQMGALQQLSLTRSQPQTNARQPLAERSTNEQFALDEGNGQGTTGNWPTLGPTVLAAENNGASVSASYTDNTALTSKSRDSARPRQPAVSGRLGNKWVIRRNLAVTSLQRNDPRPAIPEIEDAGSSSSSSLFQRSLSELNRDYWQKRATQTRKSNIPLDRLLAGDSALRALSVNQRVAPTADPSGLDNAPQRNQARPRQLKKRPPRRLDLDATGRQETPITFSHEPEPPPVEDVEYLGSSRQRSGGLIGFQASYTIDFGIAPVPPGTFFHESTFLGSGEFSNSQKLISRDLDKDTGFVSISIGGRDCRWGAWNETVSSELGSAFDTLIDGIEKTNTTSAEAELGRITTQGSHVYRSLIKYSAETLSFIDPVDRIGFVTRAHDLVSKLIERSTSSTPNATHGRGYLIKLCSYSLVFANQICHVASHHVVDKPIFNDTLNLVQSVACQLFSLVSSPAGLAGITKFLDENKMSKYRDSGVRDNPSAEAFIVARLLLRSSDKYEGWFEDIVTEHLASTAGESSSSKDIRSLETGWHNLFTTLALYEIDQAGIARIGSRFQDTIYNWKSVQRLLRPVLNDGGSSSSTQPISYINYCRVIFRRCFNLINDWGWRDCKPILNTLYDFFAGRTLYNLTREECFGSPNFLEDLDRDPSLAVTPRDSCFHILLKIIGSGLRFISKTYEKKKVRNFAWRLLPNHGRVYPKEMPLRREDLDALRNHHDLLCTLYWAVPEGCRPRLEAIKNLVDPASSHRETCKISLRSWMRLARFKLSTDEDVSGLDPFGDWHSYFVTELLKQHSQARTEVEAQSNGDDRFQQVVERTISQNQQQIEILLSSALGGLHSAVQLSPTLEHARRLVSKMPLKALLGLFNPRHSRVNSIVSEALRTVAAYTKKCNAPAPATIAVSSDDDSQEYGDWKEIFGDEESRISPGIEHVQKIFHPAVSRLVSNCFGEDHAPEDGILLSVVDCWTSVAQTLAKNGLRHWDSYLSPYDGDSWAALRSTAQTRKFTPQFLASCIEKDSRFFPECKAQVLDMWMSSLVERASMLKFQHRLTEALLNQDLADPLPLLRNLPFSKNRRDGRFSISLEDFGQRRLSLISSLLSNMREHVQKMEDVESWEYKETKQEYNELLQRLMASMKSNYQGLGNGAQSAQGAYVDFVHCVVGFLQQHARDISAIDSFFTDPKSFPLPSADPRYIVAKLKSYEPKLSSEKAVKALIVFIQGVSERAATDGEQVYLVDQLRESIANTYEGGSRPTLRAVLLQCAFPGYLEMAFKHPAAWILSRPILQTVSHTFKDLLFNMDSTDPNCVSSVANIFTSIFQATYQSFHFLTDDPDLLKDPTVQVTAASFIEMITSSLPVIEYLDRVTDVVGEQLVLQIQAFRQFALFAFSRLRDEQEPLPYSVEEGFVGFSDAFIAKDNQDQQVASAPRFFQDLRHSASRELVSYVTDNYSRHHGKYYFTRRGSPQPKEVGIDPSLAMKLNRGAREFEDAARRFLNYLQALDFFGDG